MSKRNKGKARKGKHNSDEKSPAIKPTELIEGAPIEQVSQMNTPNEPTGEAKTNKFLLDLAKTAIIAAAGAIIGLLVKNADIKNELSNISKDIGLLQGSVTDLGNRMDVVEDTLNIPRSKARIVIPHANLYQASMKVDNIPDRLSGNAIDSSDDKYVAEDPETGELLTMEDLVGEPIAFPYTDSETGDLVFFKGQYDENGYWTGNCIINKYNDNKLVMIMDAEYDGGTLISYKMVQAIMNEKKNDDGTITEEPIWSVSEREVQGGVNVGKTLTYFRDDSYKMKFDVNSFSGEDIISKDDFCNEMLDELKLEGYYNGNTSNGLFNDTSGNACMVKYTRDGYIRTFYVGNVVNGSFNDSTGSAIEIVFDEAFPENGYFYYIGNFTDGNKSGGITPYYIKQERIDEIVSQYDFDFEKVWRLVESDNN